MFALGCQDHGVTKFNNDPDATIRSPARARSRPDVLFTASGSVDDDDHATEDLVALVRGRRLACETDVLSDGETSCELMVTC